ncbi:MAG: electron transport complex subunit E [Bryobacteraceae bacterium]|nr:electron transport complex subunit E [Bryobacteraceae bacterium]MDW8379507.1 electron transport complex subunit E [Bryobacterales bacterium]
MTGAHLVQAPSPSENYETFFNGLWKQNPVFVQVLGMCPTLAVTNSVRNALAMGAATLFVLVCSNMLISLVRKRVPKQVRIATYILIIATFVTIVDYLIKALSIAVYKALGPFIALIVVNCMILGRAEAFASRNPPGKAILDGLGMGLGFSFALLCLGAVREVLGAGTFLGVPLFGPRFQPWVLFLLPPGGFLTLALWLLVFRAWQSRKERKQEQWRAAA